MTAETLVSKLPTSPRLRRASWNYPDSIGAGCNPTVAGRDGGLSFRLRLASAFTGYGATDGDYVDDLGFRY